MWLLLGSMDQDNTAQIEEAVAPQQASPGARDAAGIVEELLVEEISIDGMCGVY